jgi:hypothetical protein
MFPVLVAEPVKQPVLFEAASEEGEVRLIPLYTIVLWWGGVITPAMSGAGMPCSENSVSQISIDVLSIQMRQSERRDRSHICGRSTMA